ncbi:MAG TPA: DUF222 domain-containing protein [Candidatus Dormibacteraeota bacterium]|nr:DUF222 domain-containing protein [Candidatus Dormibacteraeota bacterium]
MLATQDVWPSSTAHLTNYERRERLRVKTHVVDVMLLSLARDTAEFAATDAWDEDGSGSAIDWLRFNCHMTSTAAADLIAVGKNLQRMPESGRAVSNGEIGFAHAKAMARTAAAVGAKFDEAPLLEKARESSPGKFYYLCQHYRHSADRAGFEAERNQEVENRKLWMSTCEDGTVQLTGHFDPEGGAVLRTAFEPLARKSGAHDDRSREKRLADAAVEVAQHALDSGQIPRTATQRTHLQVTTSLETLLGLPGAPAADMEFSLPISSKTVERLACDCSVTRILLGSDSMVIDVGRAKRTISGPARKALNVRDRGCTWPGCERPASWTSGHHLKHWFYGGTNAPPNLTLLCYRHHWMVHEGNWQIVRGDDGRMLTIPPIVTFGPSPRGPD